jgi:hypothetical protein
MTVYIGERNNVHYLQKDVLESFHDTKVVSSDKQIYFTSRSKSFFKLSN